MALPGEVLEVRELTQRDERPEADLVALLEAQALIDRISGAELARRIGVDQGLWSRVRRRIDRFGVDACSRIVLRYPELREAAARYLAASYEPDSLVLLEDAARLVRARRARAS
jgi:hypothetical protein